MSEQAPRERIFPSREKYEADPEFKEKREHLLLIISKLRACGNQIDERWEPAEIKAALLELKDLYTPLMTSKVTDDYFEQFMEPGAFGDKFTEAARHNPKIMLEWITHDLIGILRKLPEAKTPEEFSGTLVALGFYENVLDTE